MIRLVLPLLGASIVAVIMSPLLACMTPVAARRAVVAVLVPSTLASAALLVHLSLQAMVVLPVIGSGLHSWLHLDGVHIVRGGPVGLVATVLASVMVVRVTVMIVTRRRLAAVHPGGIVTLSDPRRFAYAVPGHRPGIVLSDGLVSSLTPAELGAVLHHEQAHIDGRHDLWMLAARVCVVLNPILAPVKRQLEFALERIADEAARRDCGNTHTIVAALSKAALGTPNPAPLLGIASSVVAARVGWLMSGEQHSRPAHLAAVLSGCSVVAGLSVLQCHHIASAVRAICA